MIALMRNLLLLGLGVACLATAGTPYMTEPALCPTRPELVFVSGGDIWIAPAKGGDAHLLVSHPAEESRPLYSPDGKRLAFVSTRTGNGDIYVLTLASGELKRLTYDDRLDQLDGWSRDGKWIYFSSSAQDVGGKNDIFRVSPDGGTPMVVSGDRFLNEFQAAPAPDGVTVAFAARGMGDSQWWRNGHSHIDESEIWTRKEATPAVYTKLVDLKGRNHWPMWSADGKQLYFMSDRGGTQNIWTLQPGGQLKPLTKFNSGRVLWPSIAYDGRTIVFEHEFRVWQLDVKSGDASAVPLTLVGSAAGPAASHIAVNQFSDMVVSPDGRKMALVGHGEIFATSARDGGDAVRVTSTPGPEGQVVWSPGLDLYRLCRRARCRAAHLPPTTSASARKRSGLVRRSPTTRRSSLPMARASPICATARSFASSISNRRMTDCWHRVRSAAGSAAAASPGRPTASGSPTPRPANARCATCGRCPRRVARRMP